MNQKQKNRFYTFGRMGFTTHFLWSTFATCGLLLQVYESRSQCQQTYVWASWKEFTGNQTSGGILIGEKLINVTMSANFTFTSRYANFSAFKRFSGYSTIPNSIVPTTPWASRGGIGGKTTLCFSEPVTNPVLLLSSLGTLSSPRGGPAINVTLRFSEPYSVLYDAGGTTFIDSNSINGLEGNAIIMFPGTFTCLTIFSDTYEDFTQITCALQWPFISITDKGNCSVKLVASGGKSYRWSGGDNPTSAINTVRTSGVYSVTATDQNGCTAVAEKNVVVPKTVLASTIRKTICQGEAYLGYRIAGSYVDTLKTAEGCDSVRTLHLSVQEKPVPVLDKSKLICSGEIATLSPTITPVDVVPRYRWSTGEMTSQISVNTSGLYSVTVTNGICSNTASTSVTVAKLPAMLPDETVCRNEPVLAGGLDSNLTYLWEPTGETTETIKPTQTGVYTVKITNVFNCSSVRTLHVTDCATSVFAPNTFTPNKDQINDTFKLIVTHGRPVKLSIYNRWGDLMYTEASETPQWDGTYSGDDCPSGLYAYTLLYKTFSSDDVLEHHGSILLLR